MTTAAAFRSAFLFQGLFTASVVARTLAAAPILFFFLKFVFSFLFFPASLSLSHPLARLAKPPVKKQKKNSYPTTPAAKLAVLLSSCLRSTEAPASPSIAGAATLNQTSASLALARATAVPALASEVSPSTRDVFLSGARWAPCAEEEATDVDDSNNGGGSLRGPGSRAGARARQGSCAPVRITLGTLPARLFAGGHGFFFQRVAQPAGPGLPQHEVQAVHLTFSFGDASEYAYGKRQRAREAGLWTQDDASYFGADGSSRFLRLIGPTFSADERRAIEAAHPEESPQRHLLLDAAQRVLVRDLLALAQALNASLILPPLRCACDRTWWLLKRCRHPLASPSWSLPFACPQDAMYDVARWQRGRIAYRESSFLASPRLAHGITQNAVRVFVRANAGSAAPGSAEAALTASLSPGTAMVDVLPRVLHVNPRARLVEISRRDLGGLSRWLGSREANKKFNERVVGDLLAHDRADFCTEEANPSFTSWAQWEQNGRRPALNCSKGFAPPPRLPEVLSAGDAWVEQRGSSARS